MVNYKKIEPRWMFAILGLIMTYFAIRDAMRWGDQTLFVEGPICFIYLLFGVTLEYFLRRMSLLVTSVIVASAIFLIYDLVIGALIWDIRWVSMDALPLLVLIYLFVATRRLAATLRRGSFKQSDQAGRQHQAGSPDFQSPEN